MRDYLSESSLDQASVVKHLIKLESNSFDPQNKYEEAVRDALYAYAFENVNGVDKDDPEKVDEVIQNLFDKKKPAEIAKIILKYL